MKKITIIGGTSGFGEWTGKFILNHFKNIELTITGTNEEKAKRVAEKLNCNYSTDNIASVKESDLVIFSTPIEYTEKIIKEVCPKIKAGSVVMDVTSIKTFPSEAMKKSVGNNVLVIPTHPMFGPYNSSIAGQIIALTPEKETKKDKRYIDLKNFLKNLGGKIIESTPKEHDKMMAVIQGLTHYNMFLFGECIKKLNINIQESMNFVSPIYKILISSVSRYMNHNPKLYADIQMFNPEVLNVQKTFIDIALKFNKFVNEKDQKNFINTIKSTQKYFGENAKIGQKYTDKIIYMISKQVEKAKEKKGKQIKIINIYTRKAKNGILKELKNDIIFFENNEKYNLDEWDII